MKGVTKADLVRGDILKMIEEAKKGNDWEEIERLKKELEYLDNHRSEY